MKEFGFPALPMQTLRGTHTYLHPKSPMTVFMRLIR